MTLMFRRWIARGSTRISALAAMSLGLCGLVSCSSGPKRVEQPDFNAGRAGQQAMDQYDTNGDGVVAGDELAKAPALKAALATTDTNKDGGISAQEIEDRIKVWRQMGTGLMSFAFRAALDGQPVEIAEVTFEPEAFLGDEMKLARCTTDYAGGGGATIPKDLRPTPKSPPGMQLGFYTVKISRIVNGKEMIPRKYNEETVLGQEVAVDVPEILNNRVRYVLTTK